MRGPMGKPKNRVENPGKLLKRLMDYIFRDYKFHCIIVFILIFVGVIANVQGTMFTRDLIDKYITPFLLSSDTPNFTPLAHAIGKVACFYGVGIVATYTYNRIMINVTQGMMMNMRNDLFSHMEKLPIKYFDTHAHGDIMSIYTNDIDTLRQMVSQSIPQIINSGFTIVSVFISMLILNIPLTAVTMVMVAIMIWGTKKAAGQSGKYFLEQQKNLGKVNGYIEEMMNGQKVVKVFCHEEESKTEFKKLNEDLFVSADRANTYANFLGPMNAQIGNISYVMCAIVGGALALNHVGGFTLGGLASFLTFNKSFSMPINQVSQQLNAIVMALAGAERIFTLLDEKMEVDELLALYVSFEHVQQDHMDEFSKEEIYKLITCSVDIDNKLVMDLWKDYCRDYRDVEELQFPYSPGPDLYDLESYYKMLDLYFQFSRKVGLPVQEENLVEERRNTEEEISRILKTECASYTRKCTICGRELSWDYPFSICERCFERGKRVHPRRR